MKKPTRRKLRSLREFKTWPAVPFKMGACENRTSLIGAPPQVLLTRRAYDTMFHIVDLADKEIGWLGTVERRGNDFIIDEIFLFKQAVHAAETEISEEGLAEVGHELLMSRPDGMEICNSLRFWGHSHVRMGVEASGTDETQMQKLRESDHPWFVRGIFNKNGKAKFTIFLYESGVRIDDVSWSIFEDVDDDMRDAVKAEIAAKVTEAPIFIHQEAVGEHEGSVMGENGSGEVSVGVFALGEGKGGGNNGFALLGEIEAGILHHD